MPTGIYNHYRIRGRIKVLRELRTCAYKKCGNTFEVLSSNKKYCCHRCSTDDRRNKPCPQETRDKIREANLSIRKVEICARKGCGTVFENRPSENCKYCSKECYWLDQKGRKKTPWETRICGCGCEGTFECKVSSKQRFIPGHHMRGQVRILREIRTCAAPNCSNTFVCLVTSKRKCCSGKCRSKQNWQNSKYIAKQKKARHIKPNNLEKQFGKVLQTLLPEEYKFVGDWSFVIEGKNPDFININGQKKIIEVYGDYWYKDDNPQDRIDLFAKYGYQTLVIWEHELKDISSVANKVEEFNNV
jgi:hypothetical protein